MNSNDLISADAKARDMIVNDLSSNLFVEASAGSGKTTSLVERMVSMAKSGVDIRQITAITFTKAAANEFYSRFQQKLDEKLHDPKEQPYHALYQQALLNIDLCFLGTIDSFCSRIISEHPAEAKVPMDAAIYDEAALGAVYKAEWLRMKNGGYGSDLAALYQNLEHLMRNPDALCGGPLTQMLNTRNMERCYDAFKYMDVDTLFAEEQQDIIKIFDTVYKNGYYKSGKGVQKAVDEVLGNQNVLNGDWSDDLASVIKALDSLNSIKTNHTPDDMDLGMYADYFEPQKTRGEFRIDVSGVLEKLKEYQYSCAMTLLDKFAIQLVEVLRQRGVLNFFDYLLYLRDMLRDDAAAGGKLTAYIAQRHRYFLVDEFQDTDPLQSELLFYLTAEQPDPDWRRCVPRPGSLFIVGDPKQSIYRFRNADIRAYTEVRDLFDKVGKNIALYQNFRSESVLKQWFNRLFGRLMPNETEYQPAFGQIANEGGGQMENTVDGVYKYHTESKDDPQAVAEIIGDLVDNPYKKISRRSGAPTPMCYSDIMVITRAKTHLRDYMQAFREKRIPFLVEGKTSFHECGALVCIAAVFALFADPYDATKLACVLKQAGGFTDDDLLSYVQSGHKLRLFDGQDDSAVGSFIARLRELYARANQVSPVSLFWMIEECFALLRRDMAGVEYLYYAAELLQSAEAVGNAGSLREEAAFLDALIEGGIERELQLERNADAVKLVNLHKVKGLEAPVVILAAPFNSTHKADCAVKRNGEGRAQSYCFVLKCNRGHFASTQMYAEQQEEEGRHLFAETMRLKYVAATRAKQMLIVSSQPDEDKDSNTWREFLPYIDNTYVCSDRLETQITARCAIDENAIAAGVTMAKQLLDAAAQPTFDLIRPSHLKLKSRLSPEDEMEELTPEQIAALNARRRNAALTGTMVHRLMELAIQAMDCDTATETLVQYVMREYAYPEEDGFDIEDRLFGILQAVRSGGYAQESGAPQDLFGILAEADHIYTETPFCLSLEPPNVDLLVGDTKLPYHVLTGAVDLIYCLDSKWHIVDFKTNLDAYALDEKYQNQLLAYQIAFKEMVGEVADARAYHIEI